MLGKVLAEEALKTRVVGENCRRQRSALDVHCRNDRQRHRNRAPPEAAEVVDDGKLFLPVVGSCLLHVSSSPPGCILSVGRIIADIWHF